jgi:hypothetical protein
VVHTTIGRAGAVFSAGSIIMSTETPAVLASEAVRLATTLSATERYEVALTVMFAAVAVLAASLLAVVTGLM